jgi:hypothetical protein
MRRGSLKTVSTDLRLGGSKGLAASPGMKEMGGLMSADDAGVDVKQMENVSVGAPHLRTPSKGLIKGSKTQASAGATVNKNSHKIKSPSVDLRKGY